MPHRRDDRKDHRRDDRRQGARQDSEADRRDRHDAVDKRRDGYGHRHRQDRSDGHGHEHRHERREHGRDKLGHGHERRDDRRERHGRDHSEGHGHREKSIAGIKVREMEDDRMVFEMFKTDLSVANAIRRVMIGEVPSVAIEIVEIHTNDSVIPDEFLAHRIGLIPILSHSADDLKIPFECNLCDGRSLNPCDSCCVMFEINVKCTQDRVEVTSEDLKPTHKHNFLPVSVYKKSRPLKLAKLIKGQTIHATCIAKKGVGKDHAKYSPAATIAFLQVPDIHINRHLENTLTREQKKELIDCCPTPVFEINPKTQEIQVKDAEAYIWDEEMERKAETMGVPSIINFQMRPDHFIFTVETTGAMHAKDLVLRGISVLRRKLDTVRPPLDLEEEVYSDPEHRYH